jgi:hypothetical protein
MLAASCWLPLGCAARDDLNGSGAALVGVARGQLAEGSSRPGPDQPTSQRLQVQANCRWWWVRRTTALVTSALQDQQLVATVTTPVRGPFPCALRSRADWMSITSDRAVVPPDHPLLLVIR